MSSVSLIGKLGTRKSRDIAVKPAAGDAALSPVRAHDADDDIDGRNSA